MQKEKNALNAAIKVVVLIIAIAIGYGVINNIGIYRASNTMTKAEYLDKAVPNCIDEGVPAELCSCIYNKAIDLKGVPTVLNEDIKANKPEYEPSEWIMDVTYKCLDEKGYEI